MLWCHVDGVNLRNPISGFLLPFFFGRKTSPLQSPFPTTNVAALSRKVEGKSGELAEPEELAFGRAAAQIAAAEMGVKINFKTNEEVEFGNAVPLSRNEKWIGGWEISIFRD